jgi:hypothetical protein
MPVIISYHLQQTIAKFTSPAIPSTKLYNRLQEIAEIGLKFVRPYPRYAIKGGNPTWVRGVGLLLSRMSKPPLLLRKSELMGQITYPSWKWSLKPYKMGKRRNAIVLGWELSNTASYVKYMHVQKFQTGLNKSRGWKTDVMMIHRLRQQVATELRHNILVYLEII